ncbi:MAG: 4-hydroxy-tetrahydrodipicolinate reductase [Clostridiales Family XIII bacterium]|jgi:4-hydroxy-tetrahydrodipicolinate reductase|nr:4-hydroxy-tetrahydrodipicolinate reductase [Clostridiales Family XIII bacterium]
MPKVIVSGYSGRMGREVRNLIDENSGFELVAGFDTDAGTEDGVPVFSEFRLRDAPEADIVIDFSNHVFVPAVLLFCMSRKMPVVIATTALGEDVLSMRNEAAQTIPVFHSANMSLGVNVLAKMAQAGAPALEDSFDIEIVEAHHNQKKDAPSGTAILLADAVNASLKERKEYTFGRSGRDAQRNTGEIGIHAVRGGTLPGRHTIIFAGPDEVVEITHTAYSRRVFAEGALKAAAWLLSREPGLYNMNDLLA